MIFTDRIVVRVVHSVCCVCVCGYCVSTDLQAVARHFGHLERIAYLPVDGRRRSRSRDKHTRVIQIQIQIFIDSLAAESRITCYEQKCLKAINMTHNKSIGTDTHT